MFIIQDFGSSGALRRGSSGGQHPRGPQVMPMQTLPPQQKLHHHQHQHPRGVIEYNKDESESDNAALSDQNSDYILPITQIVAEQQKKQVRFRIILLVRLGQACKLKD